jgi:hypothetical protein
MAAAFFLSAKKNKVAILPACALNLIALKWAIVLWYQALKLRLVTLSFVGILILFQKYFAAQGGQASIDGDLWYFGY